MTDGQNDFAADFAMGIRIMRDGMRIDPADFYKGPVAAHAEQVERLCEQAKAMGPGWHLLLFELNFGGVPASVKQGYRFVAPDEDPVITRPGARLLGPWD